jgi:hypothetical protein
MLSDSLAPYDEELAALNQDDPNYFLPAASTAIRPPTDGSNPQRR